MRRPGRPSYRFDGEFRRRIGWYAQWLIDLSELPDLLGARLVRSELIYLLVSLDKQFTAEAPGESWETYYARQIQRHFWQSTLSGTSRISRSGIAASRGDIPRHRVWGRLRHAETVPSAAHMRAPNGQARLFAWWPCVIGPGPEP
jgi:hypothetical protein